MIRNQRYHVDRSQASNGKELTETIESVLGPNALRWYICEVDNERIVVEATTYTDGLTVFDKSVEGEHYPGRNVVVSVIPTGVGCEIGGYAGDAAPATNLLASCVDYLITNPNAVNASDFISLDDNVLYTEGYSIDLFCQGRINLYRPYSNRVGLILECCDASSRDVVFNTVNAVRAVHGVSIDDIVMTEKPIGSRCIENQSGAFVGAIDRPDVMLRACEHLLARGADAIAVTTNVQDLPADNYAKHFEGRCPNPTGGVEAVISHLITNRFQVPAAHAPLMNVKHLNLSDKVVDARGAGEMASTSGLACVLIGLHKAPQITATSKSRISDIVNINNLLALVVPAGCLGGIPVLSTQRNRIPVIAVKNNKTILKVVQSSLSLRNVIEVRSYAEAAGVILAMKQGVSLASIVRPLETLRSPANTEKYPHVGNRPPMVDGVVDRAELELTTTLSEVTE